jgi:serine/threonine-protein kinase HipA
MAANEAACMKLARAAGLDVPDVELLDIAGTPTLAVRRYDRGLDGERVHQEDGLQATGWAAGWKYEMEGGPSLRRLAEVVRDHGPADGLTALLTRVCFNVCIGNADAHAKNFSLLHPVDGSTVPLAPAYDLVATVALEPTNEVGQRVPNDNRMSQKIDGVLDVNDVRRRHLVNEGTSWHLRRAVASETVDGALEAMSNAVQAADPWLAELVTSRLDVLLSGANK